MFRICLIASAVTTCAVIVGVIDGHLTEAAAGMTTTVCVVACCLAFGLAPLLSVGQQPLATVLLSGLGALSAAVSLVPVFETLPLTPPVAAGALGNVGDTLQLPTDLAGPVRVLVHAELPHTAAHLHVVMRAAQERIETDLDRTRTRVRVGKRGRRTAIQTHNSKFVDVTLAPGARPLELAAASGTWPVPLRVEVFREWLPDWSVAAITIALVGFFSLIAAATETGARAPGGIACALFFGMAYHYLATPDHALRPEVGALLIAVLASSISATALTALSDRLLRRTAAA